MSYRIDFTSDLRRNTYSGLFIALEGLDGSGKSSQLKPLENYFKEQGKEVYTFHWMRKDVGPFVDIIQSYLQKKSSIPKPAMQHIFSADYIIFSEEEIIPALKAGKVVIADRCHFWSAVAYGLWENSEEYDLSLAQSLLVTHGVATRAYRFIIPDVTFYLDISLGTALHRLSEKTAPKDIYEKEETLEKIKSGYEWLLREFPEEFVSIDAERSIEEVTENMVKVIEEKQSSYSSTKRE